MRKVKVMVGMHQLGEEDLALVAQVDPRVEMVQGLVPTERLRRMTGVQPGSEMERRLDQLSQSFDRHIADTEVILGLWLPEDVTERAGKLRWVHSYGAGIDFMPAPKILARGITITNSSGVNSRPIAEFCIAYVLVHAKQIALRLEHQRNRRWKRETNAELGGKTLGIIGPGRIGMAVAVRAAAMEMRLLAVRRKQTPGVLLPPFERVYPREALGEMLAQCDYVLTTVGLSEATRRMIGDAEFAAMKRGAYFMNVGRGAVVDEAALARALESGQLGGAGLDVFEEEPLSPQSPLWGMPTVFITPHSTVALADYSRLSVEFFCQNLRRYLDGAPLENVIAADYVS